MKNNAATFSHPATIQKLRWALWLTRLEAVKRSKQNNVGYGFAKTYIQNKKGRNYLRLDVTRDNGTTIARVWGDCSKLVTDLAITGAVKHYAT